MHVWWYLVVSGPCLLVSGGVWSLSGGVWTMSGGVMNIGWYDLTWCMWADIFSEVCNRCTDATDALMLLMCWCADAACWCADADVADKMQIGVQPIFKWESLIIWVSYSCTTSSFVLLVHVGSQQGLFSSFLIFLGVMMRHFEFTGFILYTQKFVTD